jgi:hypothetical protein
MWTFPNLHGRRLIPLPQILRQSRHMLLKQLLRLHPHTRILSVLELQQGRQQRGTEHLGTLTRQQRGQVVDADYVER